MIELIELARGFHIRSADPTQFVSEAALESQNPWIVLGAILVRAQKGDFSLASSWNDIVRLSAKIETRREDPWAQYALAVLLGNACDLRGVSAAQVARQCS